MRNHDLKVAVVDDDASVLELVASALRETDAEVVTYLEPRTFLERQDLASFDLILSDLMFPDQTGIDLLRSVNQRTRKPKFVIMTSNASIPTVVEAIKEGAFDYLAKPFRIHELLTLLERVRADREPVPRDEPRDFAVGRSAPWRTLLDRARRVSELTSTVLILGETGSGKEVLARYVASFGPRAGKPFVAVNCSALPENLIESELFGHARGAFTGATAPRRGLFEEASGGTLFLDEIGTMPLQAQAKVLRVLEDREVRRVGESRTVSVDVRVLAATNLDLGIAIDRREFREDLFYRLSVITLVIPPLRERTEDIPLLAERFLASFGGGGRPKRISPAALELLKRYPFPGNVRELKHAIEAALAFSHGDELLPEDFTLGTRGAAGPVPRTQLRATAPSEISAEQLQDALRQSGGSRVEAAKLLGIGRSTLYRLLDQLRLEG